MKRSFWFILAGVVAVIALIIALVAMFGSGSGPRGYVSGHYQRASSMDIRGDSDNKAYTSPKPVPVVAREITSRWRPQAQQTDSSGVYLRYPDDAVIVQPRGAGSVIHVMDVDRAYRHYHSHVSSGWGWVGTRGDTFRGGGPGTGK